MPGKRGVEAGLSAAFCQGRIGACLIHLPRAPHPSPGLPKASSSRRSIDVAFRGGVLRDSGYIGRRLMTRSGGLLASPGYIARRGQPTTLQELAHHDCVTPPHPTGHTTWRLAGPGGAEEEVQVSGRFTGNTAQALRRAALAGLGIAQLPPAMATRDEQEGRLVRVLPQYEYTGRGLSVVYPSRKHLPLAVSAFIELVMAKLDQMDVLHEPASQGKA